VNLTNEEVDTPDELLAGIFDAAARMRKREDQLRRTTRYLHTHGSQSALRSMVGFSNIYCELQTISYFCVTNLSFKH